MYLFIYFFNFFFESFIVWKYELPIAIIWSPDHWIISLFILSRQYSSCRRNLFAVGYSIYYSLIVIDHWVYHLCIDIIRVLELRTHDSIFIIFMIQWVKLLLFILIIYDFFVNCNCVWCYLIVNYFNKKVPCKYWSLYALTCSDLKDDGSTLSLEVNNAWSLQVLQFQFPRCIMNLSFPPFRRWKYYLSSWLICVLTSNFRVIINDWGGDHVWRYCLHINILCLIVASMVDHVLLWFRIFEKGVKAIYWWSLIGRVTSDSCDLGTVQSLTGSRMPASGQTPASGDAEVIM